MNVKLLPKILAFLFTAILLCGFADKGLAQDVIQVNVLKNSTLTYSFDNYSSIHLNAPTVYEQAENGLVVFNPPYQHPTTGIVNDQKGTYGSFPTNNTIEYTPTNDFLGEDVFVIRYRKLVGNSTTTTTWGTMTFLVNVVPSSLIATDDYSTLVGNGSIVVDVLNNDYSNGTGLTVVSVPVTNNGTATLINNNTQVEFTPTAGFEGIADFNYTVCDAQGECDIAVVNICVIGTNPNYQTLEIFTKEETSQVIIAALDNFSLSVAPSNGTVTDTGGVWRYHPNLNFDGTDNFSLADGNGHVQEVVIEVLDAPAQNLFLRPDTYAVSEGGEVLCSPLDNDRAANSLTSVLPDQNFLPVNGEAFFDHSTKSFLYVPNAGFTGVDQFGYRAKPPGSQLFEYEVVTVIVDNHHPASLVYDFKTAQNTPMVIAYNIPIEDYTYLNIVEDDINNGTIAFYPGTTTQNYNGEEFTGYNMLVYTPNDAFTGTETFEYEYCVGADCSTVKVNVSVENVGNGTSTLCAGPDCVWTGDTNSDGVVDVRDLLPIGWCMGDVGLARSNAATDWYGQHADDWDSPMAAAGFNVKHVDVDGDGIVEAIDTLGISQHYGLHHNPTPAVEGLLISDDRLGWGDVNPIDVDPGDVVLVPLYYGNETTPVLDAYGFTFELPYEPSFFQDVNIQYEDESWMSYNSPILTMNQDVMPGVLHSGYTRTSGVSASGYGIIGAVEFIVVDDIDGIRPGTNKVDVNFNPMGEMNGAGQTIQSGSSNLTFNLNLDEEEEEEGLNFIDPAKLLVYPNPVADVLTVHLNGVGNEVEQVIVYSVTGQEVYNSGTIQQKRLQLEVADYTDGIYLVKAFTNGGVITKKFKVVN